MDRLAFVGHRRMGALAFEPISEAAPTQDDHMWKSITDKTASVLAVYLAIRYSVLTISVPFPVYVYASPNLVESVRVSDKTLVRGCGALGDTVHE